MRLRQGTARDYWLQFTKHNIRNHIVLQSADEQTSYIIMFIYTVCPENLPHKISILHEHAQLALRAFQASRKNIDTVFLDMGILPLLATEPIQALSIFKRFFHQMCIVSVGDTARKHICSSEMICTCRRFLIRATCNHCYFVESLSLPNREPTRVFETI